MFLKIHEFNRVYLERLEECEKRDDCVDHHGFQDRRVSVQMSKQHRISEVLINSRTTPISRHFEKIMCVIRNHLLSLLTKTGVMDMLTSSRSPRTSRNLSAMVGTGDSISTRRAKMKTQLLPAGKAEKSALSDGGSDRMKLLIHWFKRIQVEHTTARSLAVYVLKAECPTPFHTVPGLCQKICPRTCPAERRVHP